MNVLPFYRSTNSAMKVPTLTALQKITQLSELTISEVARTSFNSYFNPRFCSPDAARINEFASLDVQSMIEAWPTVTQYLRQHKNFYDHLESIVLNDLPVEAQPKTLVSKDKSKAARALVQELRQNESQAKSTNPNPPACIIG